MSDKRKLCYDRLRERGYKGEGRVILKSYTSFSDSEYVFFSTVNANGNKECIPLKPDISFMVRIHKDMFIRGDMNINVKHFVDKVLPNVAYIDYKTYEDLRTFEYNSDGKCIHVELLFKDFNDYSSAQKLLSKIIINDDLSLSHYICMNHPKWNYGEKFLHATDDDLYGSDVKLVVMTWDIEAMSYIAGNFPNPKLPNDCITMIGGTVHFHDSDETLISYIFTCLPVDTDYVKNKIESDKFLTGSETIIVPCESEEVMIFEFMKFVKRVDPDIMTGFNDSSFDWTYFRTRFLLKCCGIHAPHINVGQFNSDKQTNNDNNRIIYDSKDSSALFDEHLNTFTYFKEEKYSKNYKITNEGDFMYMKSHPKIDADTSDTGLAPKSNKIIFVDTRVVYRQAFPAEHGTSLNAFLNLMGLEQKIDIDMNVFLASCLNVYKNLNDTVQYSKYEAKAIQLYTERYKDRRNAGQYIKARIAGIKAKYTDQIKTIHKSDIDIISEGAYYCIIDSFRCHQLLRKKDIVNDRLTMARICRIGLSDAFNRANSYKITQLVQEFGKGKYTFKVDMQSDDHKDILVSKGLKEYAETLSYTGAHVEDPVVGLKLKTPIVGLDFSSLYPSIIRTFNLSSDMYYDDKFCKSNLISDSVPTEPYDELVTVKDKFISNKFLTTSVDVEANRNMNTFKPDDLILKPEDSSTSSICVPSPQVRYYTHRKGLLIDILERLHTMRADAKKEVSNAKHERERLESTSQPIPVSLIRTIRDGDQKQLAVKVLMNSIYGVMGSILSGRFLYNRFTAEIITKTGRMLLKSVINYIKDKKQYDIHYGDTDSCYLSLSEDHNKIIEAERLYDNGTYTLQQMVDTKINDTRDACQDLKEEVNNFLSKITGKKVLSMAYEEVLFPAMFISKKNYYGIKHEGVNVPIVVTDTSLFARGGAIVRRSTSTIAIHVIKNILLNKLFSLSTIQSYMDHRNIPEYILTITDRIIRESLNGGYKYMRDKELSTFVLAKKYKKANKTETFINTYVNRYMDEHIIEHAVFRKENPNIQFDFEPTTKKPSYGESLRFVKVISDKPSVAESVREIGLIRPGVDMIDLSSYFNEVLTEFQSYLPRMHERESKKYLTNYFALLVKGVNEDTLLNELPSIIIKNAQGSSVDKYIAVNDVLQCKVFDSFNTFLNKFCKRYRWYFVDQFNMFRFCSKTTVSSIMENIDERIKHFTTTAKRIKPIAFVRSTTILPKPNKELTSSERLSDITTHVYELAIALYDEIIQKEERLSVDYKILLQKRCLDVSRTNLQRCIETFLQLNKDYQYNKLFDLYVELFNINIPCTIPKTTDINNPFSDLDYKVCREIDSIDTRISSLEYINIINRLDHYIKFYTIRKMLNLLFIKLRK